MRGRGLMWFRGGLFFAQRLGGGEGGKCGGSREGGEEMRETANGQSGTRNSKEGPIYGKGRGKLISSQYHLAIGTGLRIAGELAYQGLDLGVVP